MDIKTSRRAQAFVETAILLLAFAIVIAAFVAISGIALESISMQSNLRADAGENALNATAGTLGHTFNSSPYAMTLYSAKRDVKEIELPGIATEFVTGTRKAKTSFSVSIPVMGL